MAQLQPRSQPKKLILEYFMKVRCGYYFWCVVKAEKVSEDTDC